MFKKWIQMVQSRLDFISLLISFLKFKAPISARIKYGYLLFTYAHQA